MRGARVTAPALVSEMPREPHVRVVRRVRFVTQTGLGVLPPPRRPGKVVSNLGVDERTPLLVLSENKHLVPHEVIEEHFVVLRVFEHELCR